MNTIKSIEIVCPGCGAETLLRRTPRYEGFKRAGDDLSCASCGHKFAGEEEVPFKQKQASSLFSRSDLEKRPKVFKAGEVARLCRHCAYYVVNPFLQRCSLHKKEVEATDSCSSFKVREPAEKNEAPRGKPRGIPGRARAGFAESSEAKSIIPPCGKPQGFLAKEDEKS